MPPRPYFSLSELSFEKNAGYKSTVYALAELIDNSAEAEASFISIILVINRDKRLVKIAVADNGKGMAPDILQDAICEKSGEHLNRQTGGGRPGRRKFGKYGVGLPKASISQANKFTVYSWQKGGSKEGYSNGIDIKDKKWIKAGAHVADSKKNPPPTKWVDTSGLKNSKSGTIVIWEDLDGLTWSRTRFGENKGLIPQLEFQIGRTYRKLLAGEKPELRIQIKVIDESFHEIESVNIGPNDPLYITKGCKIWREKLPKGGFWPPDDPIFEETTENNNFVDLKITDGGVKKTVRVFWKRSGAKLDTFARIGGKRAGNMLHGKHAAQNVGLSLLREGREVDISQVLCNPSEPRERWFGVEFDFPQELDRILGMTNNKQSYTRLELVLKDKFDSFIYDDETTLQCIDRIRHEDEELSICLELAWKIREVWDTARRQHLALRETDKDPPTDPENSGLPPDASPEEAAEVIASKADGIKINKSRTESEILEQKKRLVDDLIKSNVPKNEALQIADRLLEQGLTYAIINRRGLGSPFFNISSVVDAKLIELNEDHPVHPYLLSSIGTAASKDPAALQERLVNSRIALLLMLEAWAKIESDVRGLNPTEHRLIQRLREDWGRSLDLFVQKFNESNDAAP